MKKVLSVLIILCLCFSIMPISALQVNAASVDDLTFELNEDETSYSVTACFESATGELVIPETYNGKTVTAIKNEAFKNCTKLTNITIPDSVTSIGYYAFSYCDGLTEITIPNSVTSIGGVAFYGCSSLTEITIPNSVTSIGAYAFYNCSSLTEITIPNSVTSIGGEAFYGCSSLTEITIPNSVTSIGGGAFYECSSLTNVTIGDGVTSIGDYAFYNCEKLAEISIPNSVTSVGDHAFDYCKSLTNVIISVCLTNIGNYAFANCYNLTEITVPNSVKSIGDYAFYLCENLTEITIPDSVTSIGTSAFESCLNLSDVWYIGSSANRESMKINSGNNELFCATWHYNSCVGGGSHFYPSTLGHTIIRKATTSKDGSIVKKCAYCESTTTTTIKYAKTFKLSAKTFTYSGKAKKPTVKVYDSAGKLIDAKNYTVYYKNNKNVGKASVVITFKNHYKGTKNLCFTINPKATTISKVTGAKKSLKVSIKKQSSQVTGYQVQYSTSKKFSSAKTKTISSYKTTSCTIKSLSAKKTYYVRVRTYKTVNGKKYYSGWSVYKSAKTK